MKNVITFNQPTLVFLKGEEKKNICLDVDEIYVED